MADEYQNAVKKLMEYLDQTAVFAKGELPDVATQMLVYGGTMAYFWLFLWSVVAAISILAWVIYWLGADSDHIPGKILTCFFPIMFISVVGTAYSEIVMIEKAPKLYIMKQMAQQIKATTCNANE